MITDSFRDRALEIFRFQASHCEPYARYMTLLGVDATRINRVEDIPYMPIEFFRSHRIYCSPLEPEAVFNSSGTTGSDTSRHYVASLALYRESFMRCFEHFYGSPSQYELRTMLPSYRPGSSLLYMVEHLKPHCTGKRVMLIGVTFALLEAARSRTTEPLPSGSIVIETGGMKGRDYQISREELHRQLTKGFGVEAIHSEYGMCELLSQAYSLGGGRFECADSMMVCARDLLNPLHCVSYGEVGGINVIDLSNKYSCSFIATGDKGVVYEDGSFEILGRIQGEILRGCNML